MFLRITTPAISVGKSVDNESYPRITTPAPFLNIKHKVNTKSKSYPRITTPARIRITTPADFRKKTAENRAVVGFFRNFFHAPCI